MKSADVTNVFVSFKCLFLDIFSPTQNLPFELLLN